VWLSGFIKRRHELSLLQPKLTSLATASWFKNVVLHMIFDILENIVDEIKIYRFEDFQYGRSLAHSPATS
jgi:hypothetical protein